MVRIRSRIRDRKRNPETGKVVVGKFEAQRGAYEKIDGLLGWLKHVASRKQGLQGRDGS